MLGAVARDAGVERVVAGVGSTRSGADAAALSHAEARSSVEAAVLLPSLGDIVDPDTLGVYAVLLRLPRDELTARLYPHALRRLMEQDTGELVDTLETYLDCSGDTTRTAAQLRVHRSTLYYRLGRIESLGAINLRDGQQRLELHLGVKLPTATCRHFRHREDECGAGRAREPVIPGMLVG